MPAEGVALVGVLLRLVVEWQSSPEGILTFKDSRLVS